MKFLTTTALAALLVGSLGISGLVPAFADDAASPATPPAMAPATPPAPEMAAADPAGGPNRPGMWVRMAHPGMPGGANGNLRANVLDIACGDRGAEALEIAFIRMQYAIKPSTGQQPLFDALKTAALADQKTFADACKTARGDATPGTRPSVLDRLQTQLALDKAKVAALDDVLPKFSALYNSLDASQKSKLEPRPWAGARMGFNGAGRWNHNWPGNLGPMNRMNHMRPMPGDGQPGTPPAGAPAAPGADNSADSPA